MTIEIQSRSTAFVYAVGTVPPVLVAAATDPAALTIDLRQGSYDLTFRSFEIWVPVGTANTDLTADATGVNATISGDGTANWLRDRRLVDGKLIFEFRAPQPVAMPEGWTGTITIGPFRINAATGLAPIDIIEETGRPIDGPSYRAASFSVPKFPPGFFFEDLAPSELSVPNGQPVTLAWRGSPASYRMFWNDQDEDVTSIPAGPDGLRRWTSPPLSDITGFLLQATVSSHGDSLVHSQTTVVTVGNPDLTPSAVDVTRALKVPPGTTLTPTSASFGVPVTAREVNATDASVREWEPAETIRTGDLPFTAPDSTIRRLRTPAAAIWDGRNEVRIFGQPFPIQSPFQH